MKNLTIQFVKLYDNEEFARRVNGYERALKTEEWRFLRDVILIIKGTMANDMFTKAHTDLSQEEKDVVQKTYFNINQILDFLSEPSMWIRRKSQILQTANRIKNKVMPNSRKGGK